MGVRLYGQHVAAALSRFVVQNVLLHLIGVQHTIQDITAAAAVPIDLAAGDIVTVQQTTNVAQVIGAPTAGGAALTAAHTGAHLTIIFRNTSGGAAGAVTWNAVFKIGGAWTSAATANSRSIEFVFNGTNWVELRRHTTDVLN